MLVIADVWELAVYAGAVLICWFITLCALSLAAECGISYLSRRARARKRESVIDLADYKRDDWREEGLTRW